jgi:hypothetical protein
MNPLRFFRRTQTIVAEAYKGPSKMAKGKKLKTTEVTADFQKFEVAGMAGAVGQN